MGREVRPIYIIRWSGAVGDIAVVVVLHSLMLQGDGNDISSPSLMVRTLGNSYRVAAAYDGFVVVGVMFVCMDVGCILILGSTIFNDISSPSLMVRTLGNSYRVAAAYVVFVMRDMLFVCMDVGYILMLGSTNFNDISSPLLMARTLGNSVGVAIS